VTAPRIIVKGATTAITRRTTLRKAFLAPWHPLVSDIWLFAIADAQLHTGVAIHHANCVINHHHLECTPQCDNLPEFTRRLHRDISCAVNTLLAHERYDCPRELFDDRMAHYMRLLDAQAQASTLIYSNTNCIAAGLVSRPEQMPGHIFDFELWIRGYLDVKRPDIYFDSNRPECIRMPVTPPPLLYEAFDGDMKRLVYHLNRLSNDAAAQMRQARNRPPMGARRIQRLHPWSEPRSLRESGGKQVPSFRACEPGPEGRLVRIGATEQTHAFRQQYSQTRLAQKAGELDQVYPYGSYAVHHWYGAPVAAAPPTGNTVLQPGPLLKDVCERLKHSDDKYRSYYLIDSVREDFAEQVTEIVEDEELTFIQEKHLPPSSSESDGGQTGTNKKVVQRHRFERHAEDIDLGARRVIVLRDRRLGRPTKNWEKHGADPPL